MLSKFGTAENLHIRAKTRENYIRKQPITENCCVPINQHVFM